MATRDTKPESRRSFLKLASVAAGLSLVPARTVRGTTANSRVELGIIGCGNRGTWLGGLFEENAPAKVVALHDYFRDRVEAAGQALAVGPARRHVGLDGYHDLLAGALDAVAVISPPYFHPEQSLAAVEAGKHVYLAKPVAVDVPGCQDIIRAGEAAGNRLSAWVDFQTRNNEFFRGAARRVHEGMIGAPVSGQFSYHCGRLGIKTPPGSEVARLRNWYFDIALSGDIIVEQNIHVLDVANWFLQGHPVKATGTGGRKARVDVGDCWDHFLVQYTYPDEVRIDFSSGQFVHGYGDLCMRLFGTEGTVDAHYGGDVSIRAKSTGWKGGKTNRIYHDGAVNNIKDFCAAILKSNPINNTREAAESTLTSILGRMSAYTGRTVTREAMLASTERLDPKLNLPADGPDQRMA